MAFVVSIGVVVESVGCGVGELVDVVFCGV